MTLEKIREKYLGKRLNLYLIDGEEVTFTPSGELSFQFKAEIFDDEALDVANNLCRAALKLTGDRAVADVEPLACQREIEVLENEFFLIDCPANEEHYAALDYALMCAVERE